MLVQFSVQNYKSIKDLCELSMVASKYFKENEDLNTFDTGIDDFPRLLKSVVIYGPNASGKSTIIDAMHFVELFVTNSANKSQSGEKIKVTPFKLCANTRSSESFFETIFIEQGVRYEYGLCVTADQVTEEWLIAYPSGKAQKWFHRVWDDEAKDYQYKFSKYFEGGRIRNDWQRQTRKNASYLSVAIQYNCEQFRPAYKWFAERLATLKPDSLSHEFTATQCKDPTFKDRVIGFIRSSDIEVSSIDIKTQKFSDTPLLDNLPEAFKEEIAKSLKDKEYHEVNFVRLDDVGQPVGFEFHEESQGTQSLFSFAGPWLDVVSNDLILFVDELDSSLHPLIVHHLVDILHKSGSKAQVIFTTHDTTILSQKILRRDQVWLISKDSSQASNLYPLSDYKVREGEAIERGYLSGRYGAIPFIKDVSFDGL